MCYSHWLGSPSWRRYKSVTSTVSCPQQPCSTLVHLCQWLLWSQSISIWFASFPAVLYFPQHFFFLKNPAFSRCAPSSSASVLSSASCGISGLICPRTHLFVFLMVQLFSHTTFQMSQYFSHEPPSLSNFYIYTSELGTRECR